MYAHLLFDGTAIHRVAAAVQIELGDHKHGYARGALRCIGQARQHQVHDVLRHVVVTGGNEYLGPGNGVATVGNPFGFSLCKTDIGTGLRFGKAHGAGPLATQKLSQKL